MRGTDRPPPARRPERSVSPKNSGLSRSGTTPGRRKTRWLAGTCTVAVHLAVLGLLLVPRASVPPSHDEPTSEPIQVSLVDTPKPPPPGPPEVQMVQPEAVPAPVMPNVTVRARALPATAVPDNSDLLSASQLAGAATVGEGGGGGGGSCDLARAVQRALRRDPMVQAAVEEANRSGKAIMLWNGDWVRSGGQDGKGLSAVREAVMWEVGFAPEACRRQPMHGLVLLSLADGGTRFAIGAGAWRWSDLLGVHGTPSDR
jgi:hypothetical protein